MPRKITWGMIPPDCDLTPEELWKDEVEVERWRREDVEKARRRVERSEDDA